MGKSARARTVLTGILVAYVRWNRSMVIRSHVKSGKDLEQEKPAVYHEYSDRDCFRDFEQMKLIYWMEAESYRSTLQMEVERF